MYDKYKRPKRSYRELELTYINAKKQARPDELDGLHRWFALIRKGFRKKGLKVYIQYRDDKAIARRSPSLVSN